MTLTVEDARREKNDLENNLEQLIQDYENKHDVWIEEVRLENIDLTTHDPTQRRSKTTVTVEVVL